ncbi:MAG: ABC transporter permease [Phyllobacteriaceae bacterium]|nr:ABC transporter permease [Phyllobacteriaceae bacterium]
MLNEADTEASPQRPAAAGEPEVLARREGGALAVALSGEWTTRTIGKVDAAMRALESETGISALTFDLAGISAMDTAGAWIVQRLAVHARIAGARVAIAGAGDSARTLLGAVETLAQKGEQAPVGRPRPAFLRMIEGLGRLSYRTRDQFFIAMHILGAAIRGSQLKIGRQRAVSPAAIVTQIERMGVGALPIVMLMSAIVGAIITQQSAFQLKNFAGELFTVDLVSVLVLRELGVLMTAIMMAGRTGSAITAEIGSMKMREEVDALTVMGLNPIGVLVFPRLIGMLVALPLLTVAAHAAAVGGGILMAWGYADIPPSVFIQRMHDWIDMTTISSGMFKAPFMAMIIAIIGSMEGLLVEGSAESLGRHVTATVVKSIFLVIVIDGFFAVFYGVIDF